MTSTTVHDAPYYRVWLIWIKDEEKFNRYRQLVAPVVGRYACTVERSLRPDTIYYEGMRKPDVVNVVKCDSQRTFEAFEADPDFQSVVHLRTESTELLSVDGVQVTQSPDESSGDPTQRLYLVEMARFGTSGREAYQRYERESEVLMRKYGYHVERRIKPLKSSNAPFTPDIVKVAYFDTRDGTKEMEKDPQHAHIEARYPTVVKESIWILGSILIP